MYAVWSVRRPRGGSGRDGDGLAVAHGHAAASRGAGGVSVTPTWSPTCATRACRAIEKNRRVTDAYRVCMLVTVIYERIFVSGRAPHAPVLVWSAKNHVSNAVPETPHPPLLQIIRTRPQARHTHIHTQRTNDIRHHTPRQHMLWRARD